MKIAVKKVEHELEIVDSKGKYLISTVKQHVKVGACSFCQFVPVDDNKGLFIGVNEDGLRLNLPTNFLFSSDKLFYPIEKMVGTVVFCRILPPKPIGELFDYELTDLTDDDLKVISHLLSVEVQKDLESKFVDYGKGKGFIIPF